MAQWVGSVEDRFLAVVYTKIRVMLPTHLYCYRRETLWHITQLQQVNGANLTSNGEDSSKKKANIIIKVNKETLRTFEIFLPYYPRS